MTLPRRPRVIANFAITADGKVSTRRRTPTRFTSPRDKQRLVEIRALGDAVLVGRGTVATDSMSMGLPDETLRAKRIARGRTPAPLRVIVSNRGSFDLSWKVFRTTGAPIVLFASSQMRASDRRRFESLAILHVSDEPAVSIPWLLETLRRRHAVRTLVCEGGPSLFRSLLAANALDELYLTITPVLFGGHRAPTLTGPPDGFLPAPIDLQLVSMRIEEHECYLRYRVISDR